MLGVQSSHSSHPAHHPAAAPAGALPPTTTTTTSSAATTTTATTTTSPPTTTTANITATSVAALAAAKKRSGALQETHTNTNSAVSPPKKVNAPHDSGADVINDENTTWGEVSQEEGGVNVEKPGQQDSQLKGQEQSKPTDENAAQQDEEKQQTKGGETLDGNDSERRASSPLSELSPAPSNTEDEPEKEQNQDETVQEETRTEDNSSVGGSRQSMQVNAPLSSGVGQTHNFSYSSGDLSQPSSQNYTGTSTLNNSNLDGLPDTAHYPPSSQLPYGSSTLTPPTLTPEKSRDGSQTGPSGLNYSISSKNSVQKVTTLLELNAELFKLCSVFVQHGVDMGKTLEAQVIQRKLQSNLHWLAAHADQKDPSSKEQSVKATFDLPEFDSPIIGPAFSHMSFPPGTIERINELYSLLPTIFAKDIARAKMSAGSGTLTPGPRSTSTPSIQPPSSIGIKRERSDIGSSSEGRESPASAKRQNTGDGRRDSTTPAPLSASATGNNMNIHPPATPMEAMQAQMNMARPSSSMSMSSATGSMGNPPNSGGQITGSSDGMFHPASAAGMGGMSGMHPGMGMGGMQNMNNPMANLSPEARRHLQMRQALLAQQQSQAQQQQHHQQQQQQHQQQQQQQQQANQISAQGISSGQMSMSPPHRTAQATPTPTQQQMMQNQMARQMSPPGTAMGMNQMNSPSVSPSSATMPGMASGTSNPVMGANIPNMQNMPNVPPHMMATVQALQNTQHPITALLLQQPGFSQLPLVEQMRRFHIYQQQHRQQQQQRMMAAGQMRPPNAAASGSTPTPNHPQNQQIGLAPQIQASNSDGNLQFSGAQVAANMPQRSASSMGMQGQMVGNMGGNMAGMPNMSNMANVPNMSNMGGGMANIPNLNNMNPAQRMYYMQQLAARNPGMANMNSQMLAVMQERQQQQQRMAAMGQRQASSSPLNPTSSAGVEQQQYPPGLRSNPTVPGIARSARSPTVAGGNEMGMGGVGTPRLGGRGLPGDDIQRAAMLQAAQRAVMPQQQQQQQQQQQAFLQGQGQGAASWPGQQQQMQHQQQQSQQQQHMAMSTGAWPQQQAQQGFGMAGSPSGDMMGSRQSSATPGPMSQQHSPTAQSSGFEGMSGW